MGSNKQPDLKHMIRLKRFGLNMKGDFSTGFDNRLHLIEEVVADRLIPSQVLLKLAIWGENDVQRTAATVQALFFGSTLAHKAADWKFDLGDTDDDIEKTSAVIAEIGEDWVFVCFNRHGNWPAVFRKKDIDYNDCLSLNNKEKTFALWDNFEWYSPTESFEDKLKRRGYCA